jgi:hypothetical protein
MFNMLSELEFLAVHELKNARQKLNVKHLGNITHVEREMDEVCDQFSKSGKINMTNLSSEISKDLRSEFNIEKNTPRVVQQ